MHGIRIAVVSLFMGTGRRKLPHGSSGRSSAIGQEVLPNEVRPCEVSVRDDGIYEFRETSGLSIYLVYYRGDRFFIESSNDRYRWTWGQDATGAVWLAAGRRRGLQDGEVAGIRTRN